MFEQDRVVGRLQRFVSTAPEIRACFLTGSFGRRAADAYSDIDAVLVFADEAARSAAWEKRAALAQAIMPYVPFKTHDGQDRRPFLQFILFANGSLVEILYETRDSLALNPADNNIRVLKDAEGWLPAFETRSAGLGRPLPILSSAELQAIDDRFWVMFWDILRQIARGDLEKPFTGYLSLLHSTLPPLLAALPATDPARAGLVRAYYSLDGTATISHLADLLRAYLAARTAVVTRHHLQPVANEPFEREIQRLLDRLL